MLIDITFSDGGFLSRNVESKNPPAVPPKKMPHYENEDVNNGEHTGIYELPPYEEHPPYNSLVSTYLPPPSLLPGEHTGIYELPPYEEHPPYNSLVSTCYHL